MTVGIVQAVLTVPASVDISCTTNGGTTTVTVTADTYEGPEDLCGQLEEDLNSQRPVTGGTWSVDFDTTTGQVTISVDAGTFSITWTTSSGGTELRDLLGFTANIADDTTETGSKQARGCWLPACPIFMAHRFKAAPRVTDKRDTVSPDGLVIGHSGNFKYRHRNLIYTHVPTRRVWLVDESESGAALENQSLERFWIDTQVGFGHSWFTVTAKVLITMHTGDRVGEAGGVRKWSILGCRAFDEVVTRRGEAFDGIWTVTFPELTSNGNS